MTAVSCSVASSTAACTSSRLGHRRGATGREVRADAGRRRRVTAAHVRGAAATRRARPRGRRPRPPGRAAAQGEARAGGHVDDVDGVPTPAAATASRRPSSAPHRAATPARPRSSSLRRTDGLDRGVDAVDRDGVGGAAQRGRDGGLVAGAHAEQRGDGAEQTGDRLAGGEQRAGAVLAVEPELERLPAGGEGACARGRRPAPPHGSWRVAPRCRAARPRPPRARRRAPPRRRRARRCGSRGR